jgi:hypothetical protein
MNEKKQSGKGLELIFVAALRLIAARSPFLLASFDGSQVSGLTPNLIVFDRKFVEHR